MKKLLIAFAALALAGGLAPAQAGSDLHLGGAPAVVHKADCDEYCAAFLEALKAADKAAAEYAEEMQEHGNRPPAQLPSYQPHRVKPAATSAPKQETANAVSPAGAADVASNAAGRCQQYFPATGMLLSVPCE